MRHVGRVYLRKTKEWFVDVFPWILIITLVTASIGIFIRLLFFTDMFSVQAITVLDAKATTEAAVRAVAEQEVSKTPWRQSIFFVQTDIVADKIMGSLPQVKAVLVKRILPGTIKITVHEKKPAMLLASNGDYYFVDDQGILFEKADLLNLPGLVLPTVKNMSAQTEISLGAPVVSPEFVTFVQIASKSLSDSMGLEVVEIRMPSLAAREVYFALNNNWEIKFDITRDPEGQISLLERVVNEMLSEEEKQTLEYIDLRIPRRVYYRTY